MCVVSITHDIGAAHASGNIKARRSLYLRQNKRDVFIRTGEKLEVISYPECFLVYVKYLS